MISVEIHSRHRTIEDDEGKGPGSLFDEDALEGACRATEYLTQNLHRYSKGKPHFADEEAWDALYPKLEAISRNWWNDLDLDDSAGGAQIKGEVSKLATALRTTVNLMVDSPDYVRRAINQDMGKIMSGQESKYADSFDSILMINQAILSSVQKFSGRTYKKGGISVRNVNACRDLVRLWEWIFKAEFPRNTKLAPSHARDRKRGVQKAFENVAPQFVFDALFTISPGWVKPGQAQEALLDVFGERGRKARRSERAAAGRPAKPKGATRRGG